MMLEWWGGGSFFPSSFFSFSSFQFAFWMRVPSPLEGEGKERPVNRFGLFPHRACGFTLIEIMVVVFILGLLVTLVAPKIMGRTDEARRTKAAADLRAIEQALHLYKLDNSVYPTTEQGLQALVTKPESGVIPARWNPEGYLEKVPVDPWGHPYLYLSNGERYTLRSLGADGEEGGEGKYADLDSHDL